MLSLCIYLFVYVCWWLLLVIDYLGLVLLVLVVVWVDDLTCSLFNSFVIWFGFGLVVLLVSWFVCGWFAIAVLLGLMCSFLFDIWLVCLLWFCIVACLLGLSWLALFRLVLFRLVFIDCCLVYLNMLGICLVLRVCCLCVLCCYFVLKRVLDLVLFGGTLVGYLVCSLDYLSIWVR